MTSNAARASEPGQPGLRSNWLFSPPDQAARFSVWRKAAHHADGVFLLGKAESTRYCGAECVLPRPDLQLWHLSSIAINGNPPLARQARKDKKHG